MADPSCSNTCITDRLAIEALQCNRHVWSGAWLLEPSAWKKKKWIFIFSLKDVNMHTLLIHNKSQMNKAKLAPMQGEMRFSLPCCIFSADRVTSLTLLGHCHGNGRTRQMPFAPIHFLWPSMNMILGFLSSQLWLTLSEYDPFKGYPSHTHILTCSSTHMHIQAWKMLQRFYTHR